MMIQIVEGKRMPAGRVEISLSHQDYTNPRLSLRIEPYAADKFDALILEMLYQFCPTARVPLADMIVRVYDAKILGVKSAEAYWLGTLALEQVPHVLREITSLLERNPSYSIVFSIKNTFFEYVELKPTKSRNYTLIHTKDRDEDDVSVSINSLKDSLEEYGFDISTIESINQKKMSNNHDILIIETLIQRLVGMGENEHATRLSMDNIKLEEVSEEIHRELRVAYVAMLTRSETLNNEDKYYYASFHHSKALEAELPSEDLLFSYIEKYMENKGLVSFYSRAELEKSQAYLIADVVYRQGGTIQAKEVNHTPRHLIRK